VFPEKSKRHCSPQLEPVPYRYISEEVIHTDSKYFCRGSGGSGLTSGDDSLSQQEAKKNSMASDTGRPTMILFLNIAIILLRPFL
jgi:hypothetical protein